MTSLFIFFLLLLFAIALACLLFPKAVQSFAVKAVRMGITSRSQGLVTFFNSKQYLIAVRVVGLIALVAALFLSIASIKGG